MWINPKFEYFVIRFVYDQLIEFRYSAGDHYIGLTRALTMFDNVDQAKVAKGLNYIEFLGELGEQTGLVFDINNRLTGQTAWDVAKTSQTAFENVFMEINIPNPRAKATCFFI